MSQQQHEARIERGDGVLDGGVLERGDGLLGRLDVIEAQPLNQRAVRYDQVAEELLAELQRSDNAPAE